MNQRNYPFVADLLIAHGRAAGADPGPPSVMVLREIAKAMDRLLLAPSEFNSYVQILRPLVRPLIAKNIELYRALQDSEIEAVVERPLSSRSDEWLREFRIDLLALNWPGLETLHEELLEPLSDAWMELVQNADWQRESGLLPPDPHRLRLSLGSATGVDEAEHAPADYEHWLHEHEFATSASRGEVGSVSLDSAGGVSHVQVTVRLDEIPAEGVANRQNVPCDVATFVIKGAGNTIEVASGGFAFVGPGCTLTLRWRPPHHLPGETLSSSAKRDLAAEQQNSRVYAEATCIGESRPVRLHSSVNYSDGQVLWFRIERTEVYPYRVEGEIIME